MAEKQFDDVKINVEFSEEQELKGLHSGEGLSVLMGKLAKAVKDIISHLADGVKHISAAERAAWDSKANGTHGHSAEEISGLPTSLPANGGNADTVGGYSPAQLIQSNPNLFLNSNFTVNQSGNTEFTFVDDVTHMNRIDSAWHIINNTLTNVTLNSGGGVSVTFSFDSSISQDQYVAIEQNLAKVSSGDTVTISAKVKGNCLCSIGQINRSGTAVQLTDDWQIVSGTIQIQDNVSNYALGLGLIVNRCFQQLDNGMAFEFHIEWMKAEFGSVATPYVPPNLLEESLKCGLYINNPQQIMVGDGRWVDIPIGYNLFDNPDFKINQRGKKEYTAYNSPYCYTADRWRIVTNSHSKITIEEDETIKLCITDTDDTTYRYCIIEQNTDVLKPGDVVTISAMLKSNAQVYLGQTNGEHILIPPNEEYGIYSCTVTLNELPKLTSRGCGAGFNNSLNSSQIRTLQIKWMKAEFGSVATHFVPPDPALEIVKCQRYYQIIDGIYMPATTDSVLGAFWYINLPNRMRVAPSVILPVITDNDTVVGSKAANTLVIGGWSWGSYCAAVNSNCVQLHLVNTDGFKNENAYKLFANVATIGLSADF